MALPTWVQILKTVGLAALAVSPLAPIAVPIAAAIAEAEQIKGATGPQKLDHVLKIATHAATVAQQEGIAITPADVQSAGADAISAAVKVTNIVHQANAPKP